MTDYRKAGLKLAGCGFVALVATIVVFLLACGAPLGQALHQGLVLGCFVSVVSAAIAAVIFGAIDAALGGE